MTAPTKGQRLIRPRDLVAAVRKEPNELRRKMLVLGYLSERLRKRGVSVFLVGGQAVEMYTAGQFTTGDIDITTTDQGETERILSLIGFSKEEMLWLSEKLGMAFHVVADWPKSTELARTIKVGPYSVRVISVEDLIVDRLAAAKFRKSGWDGEQARVLLRSFAGSINADYLRKRARQDKVEDLLEASEGLLR